MLPFPLDQRILAPFHENYPWHKIALYNKKKKTKEK